MSKLNERNKAVALEFWEALDAKSLKNSISVKLASDMRVLMEKMMETIGLGALDIYM